MHNASQLHKVQCVLAQKVSWVIPSPNVIQQNALKIHSVQITNSVKINNVKTLARHTTVLLMQNVESKTTRPSVDVWLAMKVILIASVLLCHNQSVRVTMIARNYKVVYMKNVRTFALHFIHVDQMQFAKCYPIIQ